MKKNYYSIPYNIIHVSNVKWNNIFQRYDYDYHIEYLHDLTVYYTIFKVLVTKDKKNPIFLDTELEDLIQDYFRNNQNSTSFTLPYADTKNMVLLQEEKVRKR